MNNQRIYLNKERLVALIEAVLAIIMTLLVLNLQKPAEPTLAGFWALRNSYFSYTLSFFWLGILWLSLNQFFAQINAIGSRTVIIGLVMLFVCSLVPSLTMLASDDFHSQLIQTIFGVGTGWSTCCLSPCFILWTNVRMNRPACPSIFMNRPGCCFTVR